MWNYLLLQKWMVFNFIGAAAIGLSYPIIHAALVMDPFITPIILGVYVLFFIIGTYRVWNISKDINSNYIDMSGDFKTQGEMEYHYFSKISFLEFLSDVPIKLGLFGTVLGLILVSLSLPNLVGNATSVADIIPVFSEFLSGAMIAFVSTATGIIVELWLSFLMVFVRNGVGLQIEKRLK